MSGRLPMIRFRFEGDRMAAYVVGRRGALREIDYHEAWLSVAVGEAVEERS